MSMSSEQEQQREIWLSLLRELTLATPDWFTMKGIESALTGSGDVDSIAPRSAWPIVKETFYQWAKAHSLGPVVYCPHAPHLMHMVALSPFRSVVYEVDVNARKIYWGSTLFRPEDVAPLAMMDERGFRRLRPGAEGVLKLLQNGSTRSGRCCPDMLMAKSVPELLRSDPEGVRMFAKRFGRGADQVVAAADAVTSGSWDRAAVLRAKLACAARAPREPDAIAARLRFRWQRKHCPLLVTLLSGGRRVEDQSAWLAEVERFHEVRI
jgi:hypothetical protein